MISFLRKKSSLFGEEKNSYDSTRRICCGSLANWSVYIIISTPQQSSGVVYIRKSRRYRNVFDVGEQKKCSLPFCSYRCIPPRPYRSDGVAGITISPATTRTRNFLPLYIIIIIIIIFSHLYNNNIYRPVRVCFFGRRVCECRILLYSHSHYTIVNYGNHKRAVKKGYCFSGVDGGCDERRPSLIVIWA